MSSHKGTVKKARIEAPRSVWQQEKPDKEEEAKSGLAKTKSGLNVDKDQPTDLVEKPDKEATPRNLAKPDKDQPPDLDEKPDEEATSVQLAKSDKHQPLADLGLEFDFGRVPVRISIVHEGSAVKKVADWLAPKMELVRIKGDPVGPTAYAEVMAKIQAEKELRTKDDGKEPRPLWLHFETDLGDSKGGESLRKATGNQLTELPEMLGDLTALTEL